MTYLKLFDCINRSDDNGGDAFSTEIFMDTRWPRQMFKGFLRCLFLLGLTLSGAAMADFGCPPGEEPYRSPSNPSGCWPIPTQEAPRPVRSTLADQWGVIAVDGQYFGRASGKMTWQEAEQAALDDCKANGGSRCKMVTVYSNACVATAVFSKGYVSPIADTLENATQVALSTCRKMGVYDNPDCKIIYSACSLPLETSPLLKFLKKLGVN